MFAAGSLCAAIAALSACGALELRHLRTRPYRPQTNGKAERFIQTLLRDWAYAWPYPSSRQRARALGSWLRWYNHRRPHAALAGHPPCATCLTPLWLRQLGGG